MCSLNVIVATTNSTLVLNKISVLVETVNFVMFIVYNPGKNQVLSVNVKYLDGRHTLVVLFERKKQTFFTVNLFSNILREVSKDVVFSQCGANFNGGPW